MEWPHIKSSHGIFCILIENLIELIVDFTWKLQLFRVCSVVEK